MKAGAKLVADRVIDFVMTFHMYIRLNTWTALVGGASDVTGQPWRAPLGLALDARLDRGHLCVKPDHELIVMGIATESRHIQLRFFLDGLDGCREFSGPLLKKGYALTTPIYVEETHPLIIEASAHSDTSHRSGSPRRRQIDLTCILIDKRPSLR